MVGREGLVHCQSLGRPVLQRCLSRPCVFAEFQHLRATALISPGTTPLVCPVDSLVNTHPSPPLGTNVTMMTLDPCAWRYVLTQDDLASFRSDVVGAGEIASTTYNYFYCQVIRVSAQCFISTASKSGKTRCGERSDKTDSDPEEVARARPPKDKPAPRSESSLLQKLKSETLPYARCAWCDETPKTRSMLEEHYYAIHHVCYRHHVVHLRQCSRLSWERSCDCGMLVPFLLIECFFEKGVGAHSCPRRDPRKRRTSVWYLSVQMQPEGVLLLFGSCHPNSTVQDSRPRSGTKFFGVFAFCWPYFRKLRSRGGWGSGEAPASRCSSPRDRSPKIKGASHGPFTPCDSFWDL